LSEALSYKPEGHGSVTDSVIRIPRWHNTSGRTMALESNKPLIGMSSRNVSSEVKLAGA
jgi:hypothetical protein